jgi:hypothetical protein
MIKCHLLVLELEKIVLMGRAGKEAGLLVDTVQLTDTVVKL